MPLEPDDRRRLKAAEGYMELGMPLDANEQLERIAPHVQHVPAVLIVRLQIYQALGMWDRMQVIASKLAEYDPHEPQWAIAWAYATRRVDSVEAAKLILMHALERHPGEPMLHFNLACYACQLGDLEGAKERLGDAFELNPDLRHLALEDEDLRPLWDFMSRELGY